MFVAVAVPSGTEAERGLAEVKGLDVALEDAAIVVRTPADRIELHQTHEVAAGEGIVAGGTVGLVAGMLLGLPVAGALLGMLGGGGWGAVDTGIADARLRELGESLEPGHAVVCALVAPEDAGLVREALAAYGEVVAAEVPADP